MQATIVDLRYNMKDVLKALARKEPVKIIYHGKEKGVIFPVKSRTYQKVSDHPFFGMAQASGVKTPVQTIMDNFRKGRHSDI